MTVEAKEEYRNSDPEDIPFEDDVQLAKAVEIIKDGNKG